jgi:hypothetical protein
VLPDGSKDASLNGYDLKYETGIMHKMLDIHDIDVKDNLAFRYHIFSPVGVEKAEKFVLMFHGFNEKDWYK